MKIDWKSCLKIGVSIFLLYLCITYWSVLISALGVLASAGKPLLIGAVIAYLLNILMNFYEKYYFVKKSNHKLVMKSRRPVCACLAIITCLGIVTLVLRLVVPQFVACISLLIAEIPVAINKLLHETDITAWLPKDITNLLANTDWQSYLSKIFTVFTSGMSDVMNFTVNVVSGTVSTIATIFISIIFSVYLLTGKDMLRRQSLRLANNYIKESWRKKIFYVLGTANDCFHRYIVGQCIEAVILGTLCTIGMLIFRLPYATMIGALVAVTALIPVAGAYIGAIVGAIMILTVSPIKALIFVVFLIVLQQIEGNLIYPRVVGTSVGLPGLWVLAAITIGGGLFGVLGMLAGVPFVATIYKLVKEDMKKREKHLHNC